MDRINNEMKMKNRLRFVENLAIFFIVNHIVYNTIKKHFEEEAKEFDQIILKLVPFYEEMTDALVLAIPFEKSNPINVIDVELGR